MHRKARCTYVKFHRQTAPLGPGHPSRPTNDSSSVGLPPLGPLPSVPGPYRLSDPFLLGNTGTGLTPTANVSQPPTTNSLYANHQLSFPPPLTAAAPAYDNANEYSARHRAQADLPSCTGVIPGSRPTPSSHIPGHAAPIRPVVQRPRRSLRLSSPAFHEWHRLWLQRRQ